MHLGLLGGTFDPPHMGHLWLAETAVDQLVLDRVLFLPVGDPPHKSRPDLNPVDARIDLTRLAISHVPYFALDTTDAFREPPHTTLSLLPLIRHAYPGASLWLLIGGDSLRDLPTWHRPRDIIQQCRLAALPRPGADIDWEALETAVPGVLTAVDLLEGPTLELSSTAIRHWLRAGHSVRHLLPEAVFNYIRTRNLY